MHGQVRLHVLLEIPKWHRAKVHRHVCRQICEAFATGQAAIRGADRGTDAAAAGGGRHAVSQVGMMRRWTCPNNYDVGVR